MNKKLLKLALSLFVISGFCAKGFASEDEGEKKECQDDKCKSSTTQSLVFSFKAAADSENPSEQPNESEGAVE